MPHRAYLLSTDAETICPDWVVDEDSTVEIAILAEDRHGVPLLWSALFRSADLRTLTVTDEEGEHFELLGPIASKEKALVQLGLARVWYAQAFATLGSLDAHFELFERAIDATHGAFVTVDFSELAMRHRPEAFHARFAAILRSLELPPNPAAASEMLSLADYRTSRSFPPATVARDGSSAAADDRYNLHRLLGSSPHHEETLPWEPTKPS